MHLLLLLVLLMIVPSYWKLWTASNVLFPNRKSGPHTRLAFIRIKIAIKFLHEV
jgi:hypothetical protein